MDILSMVDRLRNRVTLPVFMKEMRSRMRGVRAQVLIFLITALVVIVGIIIISSQWGDMADGIERNPQQMAIIGKSLFAGLIVLEGFLCALIAPALTSGAISIEREQQTLDFLLLTRMSSIAIVLGKFFSSLSFVGIILLCALPVAAISFLLGGVDPAQLVGAVAAIVSTVALFGAVGLYYSSRFDKTTTAVVAAYGTCLLIIFYEPILRLLYLLVSMTMSGSGGSPAAAKYEIQGIVVIVGLTAYYALILTTVITLIFARLCRRPMSRTFNTMCWLLLTGCGTATVYALDMNFPTLFASGFLPGNPLFALSPVFGGALPTVPWQVCLSILLANAPILFGAFLFIALAVGQIQQVRGAHPSNSRGKKVAPEVERTAPEVA